MSTFYICLSTKGTPIAITAAGVLLFWIMVFVVLLLASQLELISAGFNAPFSDFILNSVANNGNSNPESDTPINGENDSGNADLDLSGSENSSSPVPENGTDSEGNITNPTTPEKAQSTAINAFDSASANKIIEFNVSRFPFVKINFFGIGFIVIDFCIALAGLTRTTRKKLAKILTQKVVSEADISGVAPQLPGIVNDPSSSTPEVSTGTTTEVPVQDKSVIVSSVTSTVSAEKRLNIVLTGLGLPIDISLSKLKWVFNSKSITPDTKGKFIQSLNSYTNKSSPKNSKAR